MSIETLNPTAATPTTPTATASAPTPAPAPAPVAAAPVPFADPAALGLGAFALTTFVLSVVNAGLLPVSVEPVVLGLALFYGGIAQLIAGAFEFANRNVFGATAFCSYGAFWLAFWYLVQHTDLSGAGADAGKGVALFLVAWGIFSLYMTVAARRTSLVLFLAFVLVTVTFFLLAAGAYSGVVAITRVGGWFGLVTAFIAWYGSFAVVTNSTHKRTVLSVWPR